MTLFDAAGAGPLHRETLQRFFDGEEEDSTTVGIVKRWSSGARWGHPGRCVGNGGTPNRFGRLQHMSDDDDIPEIAAPLVAVEETNRLSRRTPATEVSRRIALVPADTEDDAWRLRRIPCVAIGSTHPCWSLTARRPLSGMSSEIWSSGRYRVQSRRRNKPGRHDDVEERQ